MTEKRYRVELTAKSLDAVRRALEGMMRRARENYMDTESENTKQIVRRVYMEAHVAMKEMEHAMEIKEVS